MKVAQRTVGTVTVITPDGPLTEEESPELTKVLQDQTSSGHSRLVVGMEKVPYMDSHGIELMLELAAQMRAQSLPLKLATLTPTCREILDLTETLPEFEIFDDVEDAVRSFL